MKTRRALLQGAGTLAAAIVSPPLRAAPADETRAFAANRLPDALAALGGLPRPSPLIALDVPDVAENGALVPISVASSLPGTREIIIVVDGNPQPVAVRFTIPPGTEPFVATRIRMAGSGTVYAAARTDEGFYAAAHAVAVTVGGCG